MEDINFDELEKKYPKENKELQQEINRLKRKLECDEENKENKNEYEKQIV